MFVKPAPGLVVRDPDLLDLIPSDGREVSEDSPYWQRRVRDGDVILSSPPVAAPATKSAAPAQAPATRQTA